MMKVLKLIWRGWMAFAHALGWFNARVLLTVTYFVVIAIAWIGTRLSRADLLDKRPDKPAHYHDREPFKDTLASCRRQF
jgi:Saxitoxin biosynthesis operon protein SxtJ